MSLIVSVSGIRGTIGGISGNNLTPPDIIKFSLAYGQWINLTFKNPKIVLGRDARTSGKFVSNLVCSSLQSLGIDVIDLGLSTTPTVEVMVQHLKADGGIIITASHNPFDWNALKLLNHKGEFISAEDGEKIIEISNLENIEFSLAQDLGDEISLDKSFDIHVEKIIKLPIIPVDLIRSKKYHIVVDCINSTGSLAIPILLDALGCSYELINGIPNGEFAHNPEPLEHHLRELIESVKNMANLGIAVDPDVDRLALVDEFGTFYGEEYSLVCVADFILNHKTGNTVSNLSSSRALADLTRKKGGQYYASAVGEVHVVKKMKEVNAIIGGEGNGGIILPELHYGRDALVGIALILSNMASSGKTLHELKESYPKYSMHKDKIQINPNINYSELINYLSSLYQNDNINLEDGLKIDFENSWLHLRKSNTEPIIRIYSESTTESEAKLLVDKIKSQIIDFQ